ncbi:MAG: RNA polymerase C-22 sterol desaturase [Phylliscum demangeonii]|nr:MAG: RNA polymerase C-22 sterol desaturase [Phylliscum demangeonii]
MSLHEGVASPTADAVRYLPPGFEGARLAGQGPVAGLTGLRMDGWTIALTVMVMVVVYDQVCYIRNKGSLVGPTFKIPFMGPFLESVYPQFERYQQKWTSADLSCVSVFHKFVVIASSRDLTRKVLNSPQYVKPCVVDIAQKLLGRTNFVFLDGKAHSDYRRGLNGLFTRQALAIYLPGQEEVYDRYFDKWRNISKHHDGHAVPFMPQFRELNCAVSCRTFVGHYMSDEAVKRIADDYYNITASLQLVNFPIILPFMKTWYGKKAADMVLAEFAKCAAKSKARMRTGADVSCVMDAWIRSMILSEEYRRKTDAGTWDERTPKPAVLLREFTDFEIAQTIFTFLFASQDASSSATTWLFQLMADRPEILARVREENLRVRGGDRDQRLTMDLLDQMTYTRAVVKEVLRYRPPVIMVPYLVKKTFPVTETYSVPKGSMIVPSLYPALHDPTVYPDPNRFDPDRWITGTAEQASKNFLVFGTGPHYCIGQTYAQLNLMGLIGKAALHLDWRHETTPQSEMIKVFATIFPQDDCLLAFEQRP